MIASVQSDNERFLWNFFNLIACIIERRIESRRVKKSAATGVVGRFVKRSRREQNPIKMQMKTCPWHQNNLLRARENTMVDGSNAERNKNITSILDFCLVRCGKTPLFMRSMWWRFQGGKKLYKNTKTKDQTC